MARTRSTDRGRRQRRLTRLGSVIVAAAVVPACTGGDDTAVPTTAAITTTTVPARVDDGQLVLGAFLPRTGPGAVLGEPMIAAIEDAVSEINRVGGVLGQPVDLQIVDENSGSGMAELVERGVDAIVGPASSTVALSQLDETVDSTSGVVTCSPTATAIALDDYPDNRYFFRTVPSDSLQMGAIASRSARTGVESVAVGYLDDTYGRDLVDAFEREAFSRSIEVATQVGFNPDQEDLAPVVAELLADDPNVVVVLGDADDGTRLLAQLDASTQGSPPPLIIVNDALRNGRQTIQTLSDAFRERIIGIAPYARASALDFPGFFTAHAVDCVNLIALAAIQAGTDAPRGIQAQMAAVSTQGRVCTSFEDCVTRLGQGLQIDYNGLSSDVDLSSTSGDLTRGWFEVFAFDDEGVDFPVESETPFRLS